MRRHKQFGRGRGGGGGGRGGFRRGGGSSGSRGRGHHNRRGARGYRQPAESGNRRERIAIESGHLVLIDQFMLANPQFIEKLEKTMDQDPAVKDQLIKEYGGCVVELNPSRYRIERDPYAYTIVIHAEGSQPELSEISTNATLSNGYVFVDTRCLAMIDRELLDDRSLLEKYHQLWFSGQDKACRDLLRDNGGAVRYGFSRYGDELGVYMVPDQDVVALWPDINENLAAQGAEA